MPAITAFDNRALLVNGREYRQGRSPNIDIWIEHRIMNGKWWYELDTRDPAGTWAGLVARATPVA